VVVVLVVPGMVGARLAGNIAQAFGVVVVHLVTLSGECRGRQAARKVLDRWTGNISYFERQSITIRYFKLTRFFLAFEGFRIVGR
jgi:hypothetical protein